MGADVKQTGEEFEAQPEVPALAGPGRQPEVLRRRARRRSARKRPSCCWRPGIIKAMPDMTQAGRHAASSSDGRAHARRLASRSSPVAPGAPGVALGIAFFVALRRRLGARRRFGGFVSKTFLADPLTMVRSGCDLLADAGLRLGHRHDGVARVGGFVIAAVLAAAARRGDGRVQAGRGVLRALRQLRALPAGVGLHPAADPLGRHRRGAEAGA